MGRKGWMFVGSELAGQRAATVMSLVQSAKLQGHDPWAYLRHVLQRLPTQRHSRITAAASLARHGRPMKHIEALIDDGGQITFGPVGPIECAATADDGHNTLAMLIGRDGEALNAFNPPGD